LSISFSFSIPIIIRIFVIYRFFIFLFIDTNVLFPRISDYAGSFKRFELRDFLPVFIQYYVL
jgi:hypothetical protein